MGYPHQLVPPQALCCIQATRIRKYYKPVVLVIVRSFFDLKDQCHHILRCRIGETAEP